LKEVFGKLVERISPGIETGVSTGKSVARLSEEEKAPSYC
jgi:hypothetical protein